MLIILFILACIKCATTARILGIVPTPSYSHQVTFRPLWTELSLRGHEVVVITTDPMNNATLTNLTEIDLHSSYAIWIKQDVVNFMAENESSGFKILDKWIATITDIVNNQMCHPEVKKLYNSTFDVVLTEVSYPSMCAFSQLYNCPCIGITSMDLGGNFHEFLGNSGHPVLYSGAFLPFHGKLNFWERLGSTLIYLTTQYLTTIYMKSQEEIIRKHFGLIEISSNDFLGSIDLAFVNVNPILYPVRPVTPATILIGGGIHISAPKPLPKVCSVNFMHFMELSLKSFIFCTARARHYGKICKGRYLFQHGK